MVVTFARPLPQKPTEGQRETIEPVKKGARRRRITTHKTEVAQEVQKDIDKRKRTLYN